ncbi:MAG TPA: glutamine-hydrolyzing GMP synthase, partial [Candidatus Limnocylindrales bacterium]|nr:glutamine-hydrolyzing GMP synthase [Candidatus Limnocylindrales bacterium]
MEHFLKDDSDRPREKVVILNFGGQHSMLIARRIREAGVYCELLPFDTSWEKIKKQNPAGIILSGSPASIYQDAAPWCDSELFTGGIPVLGICYGMQLLAKELGGKVEKTRSTGLGRASYAIVEAEPLFTAGFFWDDSSCGDRMSYPDEVLQPPAGFTVQARFENGTLAAIGDHQRKIYGVQFHPEAFQTPGGSSVLHQF